MKLIKAAAIAFALLLVLAGAIFYYFFYTTSGVHFLIGAISRLTPAKITSTDLRGDLARRLSIAKLHIRLPETTVAADKVLLSLQPLALLSGRLDLRKLELEGVTLLETGPEKEEPISFVPPRVPRIVAALTGRIREFKVEKLSYGRRSEDLTIIDRASGRAEWYRGKLSVHHLFVSAAAGQATGRLNVGFYRPLLQSELWIHSARAMADLDKFFIRANLKPAVMRRGMTGTVTAWAYRDTESRMALDANLSAFERHLDIRTLAVTRAEQKGVIRMSGRIATDKTIPSFALDAKISQFPLTGLVSGDWTLNGKLDIAGTADAYKGGFAFSNAGKGWQAFKIDGRVRGDRRQLTADIPRGEWLSGIVTGTATIDWEKDLQISGNLSTRGLNTVLIDETWQGVINSDASFRLHRFPSGELTAALKARLLDSSFRQRPVRGVVNAVYEKGNLRLEELALKGRSFDVFAKGSLAERINFNATIQDLSSLIPDAKGVVSGRGSVRYVNNNLGIKLSANGRAIQYQSVSVGAMRLTADLDQIGTKSVRMEANGQSISYAGIDFKSVRAAITGKTSAHEAFLAAYGSGVRMQAALTGSYEKGVWKGSLKELRGSDKQRGGWHMESPVSLVLSEKRIYLDPLVLIGGKGESIAGAVDLHLKPIRGFFKAEWQNLDLSRFDPITPVSLYLRSRGHIFLQWTGGVLDRIDGETTLGGGQLVYKRSPVSVSQAMATMDWTPKGLKGIGQVIFTEGGSLRADIASSLRPRIGLPDQARFSAGWQDFRLAVLNPFLPTASRLDGTASGRAEGRLLPNQAFSVELFDARVSRATVTQKKENQILQLSILDAQAEGRWSERNVSGRLRIDAGATGNMDADFVLPIPARLPLKAAPSGPVSLNARARIRDMRLIGTCLPEDMQKPDGRLEFSGSAGGTWGRPSLHAELTVQDAGVYLPGPDIDVRRARIDGRLSWTWQGLSARVDGRLNEGGIIQASAASPEGPRMGLPETAILSARWQDFNLGLIKPLLPAKMGITGRMVGSFDGSLLPGRKVVASMESSVTQGDFTWRTDRGLARAALRKASLQAFWSGEDMRGQMSLDLARQGRLQGAFLLPIPARLPVQVVRTGLLNARIEGQMQEEGILSAFFPGLVQEVKGFLAVNAEATGTWDEPRFAGNVRLSNAGAYLPTAGITIKAVNANIVLSESGATIQEFHAESGSGRIDGSGTVSIRGGRIEKFAGKLTGDRFQALYLPDLRLRVSPSLNLSGTGETVAIDGDVNIPQLLVYGPPTENVVRSSPDVVIVGAKEKEKGKLPVELKAKVRVVLGDDVRLRMQGIDAKLEGSVQLDVKDVEDINGSGEIRIAKGEYQAYGVELQVTRGRMVFAGPLERGRLDILAVRKIEGVVRSRQISDRLVGSTTGKAKVAGVQPGLATSTTTETQVVGVQIAGIIQKPRISLYSNPPLSDSDTLSYMILGRPVSGDAAQASLLFGAAGSLLGGGSGGSVQEQIKNILGLETLEIGTETVATEQGQVEQTMVRVGRYLAPNLYIGFGRSLFSDEYVVTARYNLSKRWEIQTRTGTQTGGDIYYKVEFD